LIKPTVGKRSTTAYAIPRRLQWPINWPRIGITAGFAI
jgi:hypothetical protein